MTDNFECPHCGESFDGPRYLSAHIIREHREPYAGEDDD
jgi:hypothetical protein